MVAEISVRVFRFPVTDVIDMIALILFSVFQYLSSSSALSVMSKSSGHESLISAAFFKTLATVFLDTPQLLSLIHILYGREKWFCSNL